MAKTSVNIEETTPLKNHEFYFYMTRPKKFFYLSNTGFSTHTLIQKNFSSELDDIGWLTYFCFFKAILVTPKKIQFLKNRMNL